MKNEKEEEEEIWKGTWEETEWKINGERREKNAEVRTGEGEKRRGKEVWRRRKGKEEEGER